MPVRSSQVAPPCSGVLSWRWTCRTQPHPSPIAIQCKRSPAVCALTGFYSERARDGGRGGSRTRSHLAPVGLITRLRRRGDCLLLPQASTIRLAAVCPSPHFLLPLLWLSSRCRYPRSNVQQHKGRAGRKSHPRLQLKLKRFALRSLFRWSHFRHPLSSFPGCVSLIPLMYVPTSLCLFLLFPPSLLPSFFSPHVWCGCPAEDDLSGQSYYPFGRVGIITIEWCTHLHAHRHGNMNVQASWKHGAHTHTQTYRGRKCEKV